MYKNYPELLKALENMFKFVVGEYSERQGYKGFGFVPTCEEKDGEWMLVGNVQWDMFSSSCQKLRIMKGFEAPATLRSCVSNTIFVVTTNPLKVFTLFRDL